MNPDSALRDLGGRAATAHRARARPDAAVRGRRGRDAGSGDAVRGARRRQAHPAAARLRRRRGDRFRPERGRRGRGGGRADPRLFARARRPAVHGRRCASSWQAHVSCRLRRGDGAPRRRRTAGARVRRVGGVRPARPRSGVRAARVLGGRSRDGGRPGDRPGVRRHDAAATRARTDAPDEDGCVDPRRGASGGDGGSRRTGGHFERRSTRTRLPRALRSRSSTTCSTSKGRPCRSARRPARMLPRASRRSSRCSVPRGHGNARRQLRVEAHAALAPLGPAGRRLAELADWIVLRDR